jgi:GT2 family glycosyltransferase
MPTVSVVVLNWNGVHLLPGCLDSLRAQTFRDFEIIMPDNGSTDGSLELVAARYSEVQVIRFPGNTGFCLAMNAGLRASRGEFLLSLNNDTELEARCLGELVEAMQSDAGLGMAAPKMVYHDDPGLINSAGHACGPDGVVVDIGRGQPDGEWFNRPREVLGACAGAALYRRQMLAQVGLFDPDFFISYEDADLNWRAQWAGWRARYVPTAVVRHREGISRGIRSRRAVFLGMRNGIHVWTKDWPLRSLWRHRGAIWGGWRASARGLIGRREAGLLAAVVWGALGQTPRMLSRRRRIGSTRAVSPIRFEELLAMGRHQVRLPPED